MSKHLELSTSHCAATRVFVKQVHAFTRVLAERQADVARFREATLRAPSRMPELEAAVDTMEAQQEELNVAEEELRTQIEALEDASAVADRERLRFRELFDLTPLPLLVVDRSGVVSATNRAAEELFDVDAQTLRGRAFATLAMPADSVALREHLDRHDGIAVEIGLERVPGGSFRARVTCSSMDAGTRGLVSVERVESDVPRETQQLRRALRDKDDLLERERGLRDRLERTDRAKDRFIAVLSHDLRGPINAVLGWTHILRKEHLSRDVRTRAFETIERSTRTQLALVEELLDLSRIAADKIALELRPVDLRMCAKHVIDSLSPGGFDAGVAIEAELADDRVPVFADHERLEQVITNLVSNAIKFTPAGGHIRISVKRDREHALLDVVDDGQGMDPAAIAQLFECYRQGSGPATARSGLGLGLYIVRRLVELHGGTVDAASEGRAKGSRFSMRLPLAQDSSERVSEKAVPAPEDSSIDLQRVRVLVVDDDPDARDLLSTLLARKGAYVFAASDATQALAMFDACKPDVVVSDIELPDDDGCALLQRIRAREGGVPAIAVSGFAAERDAERAHDAGFDVHLPKPIEAQKLVGCVRELWTKGGKH